MQITRPCDLCGEPAEFLVWRYAHHRVANATEMAICHNPHCDRRAFLIELTEEEKAWLVMRDSTHF